MADRITNSAAAFHSSQLRAGAAALQELIHDVRERADADLGACWEADADLEGRDGRDYRALSTLVQAGIESGMHHPHPAHREGFLRALTDLLSMVGDGSGPDDDWDPISTTAAAFAGASFAVCGGAGGPR